MKREDSLDALVIYNPADREGFVNPAALACDYRAGEYLDALFVTLPDSATYVYRIACFKMRYFFLQTFTFNSVQQFSFH